MSTITTTVERPLGLLEKYQLSKQLTNCYGSVTATAILRHSSREKSSDLQEFYFSKLHTPLTTLVEKHPQLALAITEGDKSTAHFIRLDHFNLSTVVKINAAEQIAFWDESTLTKVIAKECDHEFNLQDHTAPLWHLRICTHENRLDECSITFTTHHTITDGKSLSIFWKALLQELNQERPLLDNRKEDYDIIKPKVKAVLKAPYEDRQAPMPSTLNMLGVVSQIVAKKVLPNALKKGLFPHGWAGDYPAITDKSEARHDTVVRTIKLSGARWKEVCTTCRKHGVTPHAAIMTAAILAFKEVYPETKIIGTGTPVNCRSFCNPPVPEDEMGNFVGEYNRTWKLSSHTTLSNFWNIAKIYQAKLRANKKETAKDCGLLKYLDKYPEDYYSYWYDHWKLYPTMHRSGGIEFSDLGKFIPSIKEEADNTWQLEALWFSQSAQIFTAALSINSISTNDTMFATIGYQNGSLDESKVDTFVPLVIQNLKNCI